MDKKPFEQKLINLFGDYIKQSTGRECTWMREHSQFFCEMPFGLDRYYINLVAEDANDGDGKGWYKRYRVVLDVSRHFDEVEEWYPRYGSKLMSMGEKKLHPTLFTNPNKVKDQIYDVRSMGPGYGLSLELSEEGLAEVMAMVKADYEKYIFPTLEHYSNIQAVDQFLHDDIARLEADYLGYYQSKGWLVYYRDISLRSLYLAQLANNPDYERIYQAVSKFMQPFLGKDSVTNENMFEALENIWNRKAG